jgi:hypothetical protein
MKSHVSRIAPILCALSAASLLAGCATIPNGGIYGPISGIADPGPVLGTVQVGEGMLVQTIQLVPGKNVNIQINKDEPPTDEHLLFENVLTIGQFSRILGSGFTGKKNIYYQKRIHDSGRDFFKAHGNTYLVSWKCDHKDARTYLVSDHYTVTIQKVIPTK